MATFDFKHLPRRSAEPRLRRGGRQVQRGHHHPHRIADVYPKDSDCPMESMTAWDYEVATLENQELIPSIPCPPLLPRRGFFLPTQLNCTPKSPPIP